MSTPTTETGALSVYATVRVWCERTFEYEEWSGRFLGPEEAVRAQHQPPFIYVLNVRSL